VDEEVDAPPAALIFNDEGASDFLLLCEHASNYIPPRYQRLGLSSHEIDRHIAWDIGAAKVARRLAEALDAPLILSGYSRLLIDCNRPLGAPSSIPVKSENTPIPGNVGLTIEETRRREEAYFWPFFTRVSERLDCRAALGKSTLLIGVHSFTPVYNGAARPWRIGVLYGEAKLFGRALLERLCDEPGLTVGENEPYCISLDEDLTVPVHGDRRGVPAALLEIRQDLVSDESGVEAWARRLALAIAPLAERFRRER
jgi:predicted N-formylglutamate amidohydrolase